MTESKKKSGGESEQHQVEFLYRTPAQGPGSAAPDRNYEKAMEEQKLTQYPFLASAPLDGAYVAAQPHAVHPMGLALQRVKCAKCGMYGHKSGEKSCPMLGVVTAFDKQQVALEDPLQKFKSGMVDEKFALRSLGDSVIGGLSREDPNLQMIESDKSDSSSSESEDEMQQAFLESLSRSQMKTLLKEYKRAAKKGNKDPKKDKKKKEKSSKKEKKNKEKKSKKLKKEKSSRSSSREGERTKRRKER